MAVEVTHADGDVVSVRTKEPSVSLLSTAISLSSFTHRTASATTALVVPVFLMVTLAALPETKG
jgi:hypothetical protein